MTGEGPYAEAAYALFDADVQELGLNEHHGPPAAHPTDDVLAAAARGRSVEAAVSGG